MKDRIYEYTENALLSKVLDTGNYYILGRYSVTENDFHNSKEAYQFIRDYYNEYGNVPNYLDVVDEVKSFHYETEVSDNLDYLCKKLKSNSAEIISANLINNEIEKAYNSMDGAKFTAWLKDKAEEIYNSTRTDSCMGIDWSTNGKERQDAYLDMKNNKSNMIIPTPYPTLTKGLGGGFLAGDYVLLEAFTNKGKSWIASHIGLTAWLEGNAVIHYSPELSRYNQSQRLDTLLGHFNNIAMRNGELYEENEERYFQYLDAFKDGAGNPSYIIKTMEDLPQGLTVDTIEGDIKEHPEVKMVIVDGFNLMTHKGSRNDRNAMSATSRKLRQICGRYNIVLLLVHQISKEGYKDSRILGEDDSITVNPPDLTGYSETIAVIQDACTVLTYDYNDGEGALKVAKTRANNINDIISLSVNYNMGYIEEKDNTDVSQF